MQTLIVVLAVVAGVAVATSILLRAFGKNRGVTLTELNRWFRRKGL